MSELGPISRHVTEEEFMAELDRRLNPERLLDAKGNEYVQMTRPLTEVNWGVTRHIEIPPDDRRREDLSFKAEAHLYTERLVSMVKHRDLVIKRLVELAEANIAVGDLDQTLVTTQKTRELLDDLMNTNLTHLEKQGIIGKRKV